MVCWVYCFPRTTCVAFERRDFVVKREVLHDSLLLELQTDNWPTLRPDHRLCCVGVGARYFETRDHLYENKYTLAEIAFEPTFQA